MGAKILVIDDEEILRLTMKGFLSKEGHEVLTVKDYTSALEVISKGDLDLIFADIVLGDHTGIDILRAAKNRGLTCPIVMITGYPNIETASEALRLGAFDYLAKPIRRDTLLRTA
ncbi:MAG: response regulator, partial [Deltaproteobacteria bacterium]|nr:response regulator [Deltaproteobacteria bacterium]